MVSLRSALLILVASGAAFGQSPFYLKDGDRVVFYGDSITDQRLYTTFVETYAVTRFPTKTFTFTHSGWGGDRVSGGGGGPIDKRLVRDVFPYKPTVVTIMLGMNDAEYKPFDQQIFDKYASGYQHIIESLKATLPGVRITVILPSPYDDVTMPPKFEGGYNATLLRYSEFLKELARRDEIDIADMNKPVVASLGRAFAADAEGSKRIIPDRVHPGPGGHLLMAEALLKDWHATALVAAVEIDAASGKATATNASVTDVVGTTWTETDQSLPMPIDWKDKVTVLAVDSSDVWEVLDQEMLRVIGLAPGRWVLRIDGLDIAPFEAVELAEGVNLAKYDTPMMRQAASVHKLTLKHANLHNTRWRNVQVPLEDDAFADKDAAMALLDKMDLEIVKQQHALAQPIAHKFEIVPQPAPVAPGTPQQ